jgi:hypothetical protein
MTPTDMAVITRVENLIRLATDPAAAEAESRTSALIACKMIRERDLSVFPRLLLLDLVRSESRREPPKPPASRTIIRAKFDGFCRYCGFGWVVGQKIAWCREHGAACLDCKGRGI